MGKYKIRVKVEFVECDEAEQDSPMKQNDGSFEMSIDGSDAISIVLKPELETGPSIRYRLDYQSKAAKNTG